MTISHINCKRKEKARKLFHGAPTYIFGYACVSG